MRYAHSPLMTVMIAAVEKAGRALMRDFGEVENLQISRKGPADFVSAADKKSEKILTEELLKARPTFSVIAEEGGEIIGEDKEFCWIIDPLDGTMNFLHGIPHWSISIAARKGDEIIAGIVYDPIKNDMFIAEKGKGAFSNNSVRLRVSQKTMPIDILVGYSGQDMMNSIKKSPAMQYRNMGSAALHLAYLAAGKFDVVFGNNLKIWDKAAGVLLIKEAGGFISDLEGGKEFLKDVPIVAANPALHNEILKMVKEKSQSK